MNRVLMHEAINDGPGRDYITEIPANRIKANPYQPRKEFSRSALYDLANSIKEYGILQPITVRPIRGENTYQLIAGERRLRAAKIAGLSTVPAIVYNACDHDAAVIALIENLQRENLSFLEEAEGYYSLLTDHGMTQEEIAHKVGKSQSAIANKVRLLKLPPMVKKILCDNKLSERHARALLRMYDEQLQLKALKIICERHCSVKEAEEIIDRLIEEHNKKNGIPGCVPLQLSQGQSGAAAASAADFLSGRDNIQKSKKGNVKFVVRDIKIFVNTIKQTVSLLKRSGVEAKAAQFDRGDYYEFVIRIPKQANGLVINGGIEASVRGPSLLTEKGVI